MIEESNFSIRTMKLPVATVALFFILSGTKSLCQTAEWGSRSCRSGQDLISMCSDLRSLAQNVIIENNGCRKEVVDEYSRTLLKGDQCLRDLKSDYSSDLSSLLRQKIRIRCDDMQSREIGLTTIAEARHSCRTDKKSEIVFNSQMLDVDSGKLARTYFHETLHLLRTEGLPHFVGIEVPESCSKCCFSKASGGLDKDAACRICRGDFKVVTPEYLLTLFDALQADPKSSDYIISSTMTALYWAKEKRPFIEVLPKVLSGNTGFFSIAQSLERVFKKKGLSAASPIPASGDRRENDLSKEQELVADKVSEALFDLLHGAPEKARQALALKVNPGSSEAFSPPGVILYNYQRLLGVFLAQYEEVNPPPYALVQSVLRLDTKSWVKKHPSPSFWPMRFNVIQRTGTCRYEFK